MISGAHSLFSAGAHEDFQYFFGQGTVSRAQYFETGTSLALVVSSFLPKLFNRVEYLRMHVYYCFYGMKLDAIFVVPIIFIEVAFRVIYD